MSQWWRGSPGRVRQEVQWMRLLAGQHLHRHLLLKFFDDKFIFGRVAQIKIFTDDQLTFLLFKGVDFFF